jgi:hypothetical protein
MNPSMVAVYDVPKELETAKLAIPCGKFTTKVVSAGVFCELLLARVRVRVTAWPVEMPAHVVVLVPVIESKGGAVVGPGVTATGVVVGPGVAAPGVMVGLAVAAPGAVVGLGVAVLCHRGLWFSRDACTTLGDRACTDRRMLATTNSSAGELRTKRARIRVLSLPFKRGSAITRAETGGPSWWSDQLSTPGAA